MEIVEFVTQTAVGFIALFAGIVLALVQVVKALGLNTRYAPLLAVVFGGILGYFFGGYPGTGYDILAGVLAGLTAAGVYGGTKKTIKG